MMLDCELPNHSFNSVRAMKIGLLYTSFVLVSYTAYATHTKSSSSASGDLLP